MTEATAVRPGVKRFIGIDWDFGALKSAGRTYWSFVAMLSIIAAIGITAWIIFMTQGAGVMAQRDGFTWGLWFSNYMYYVGL
jgi:Ni/Fe-hydrogenase subunit HybB-like protein